MLSSPEWRQLLKELNEAARRERNGRPPHFEMALSLARRPLVTSRFAVLLPLILEGRIDAGTARRALGLAGNGPPYRVDPPPDVKGLFQGAVVLDPFAGGGSIPLEAARLGAKAIALEYSPVQWAILEGMRVLKEHELIVPETWERLKKRHRRGFSADMERLCDDPEAPKAGPLVEEGCQIAKRLKGELSRYYPDYDGRPVTHYLWAKQVRCPKCGAWVPLVKDFGLDDEGTYWKPVYRGNDYEPVVERGEKPQGTVKRGEARCPRCNYSIDNEYVRNHIKDNDRLVLVRTNGEFKPARPQDVEAYSAVPQPEPMEEQVAPTDSRAITPPLYGYVTFGDLFNKRQLYFLQRLTHEVEQLGPQLRLILAWLLYKAADRNSILTLWDKTMLKISDTLSHKTLKITWDYVEVNPFVQGSGSLWVALFDVLDGAAFLRSVLRSAGPIEPVLGSATSLPFPDRSLRLVVTDPPYFDNIPYPEVYDFAYVWLKRVLADVYPEQFGFWTLWRDRSDEDISVGGGRDDGHYRALLLRAFREIRRVLADDGYLVLFFAHSRREAWTATMSTLNEAGFSVVEVVPVRSESETDVAGRGDISFQTSLLVVARPRAGGDVAYVERIRQKIDAAVRRAVEEAVGAGYRGIDVVIAAYAAALREAGRYGVLKSLKGDAVGTLFELADEMAPRVKAALLLGKDVDRRTIFYVETVREYGGVLDDDTFTMLARMVTSRQELAGLFREARKGNRKVVEVLDFPDRCGRAAGEGLVDLAHRALCGFMRGGRAAAERELSAGSAPYTLEDVCRFVEVVHVGWGRGRDVAKEFLATVCGGARGGEAGLLKYT